MEIKPFNPNNIDEVAKMAMEFWGDEDYPDFTRVFCGYLTRYNYYTSELSFQAEDEDGLQAIAFTWMPGDKNDPDPWLHEQLENVTDEVQGFLKRSITYMKRTDEELLEKMEPNAIKLSFIISRKPGCGTLLLHHLTEKLRQQGTEWLYLWTDTWCNWQYYPRHGYEQIGKGILPEFSDDNEKYYYYMFRKQIG